MRAIDLDTWKRRDHFRHFRGKDLPWFDVCLELDVTRFSARTRAAGLPFHHSLLHAATSAANAVPEFRHRLRDGLPVEHERIHPFFTDMDPARGDDLFHYVLMDHRDDLTEFVAASREASREQSGRFAVGAPGERDDVVYMTCTPWYSFTHISHAGTLDRDDCVPKLAWGRHFERDGKRLLPFSVQANHVFVDGIHVARFLEALRAGFLEAP